MAVRSALKETEIRKDDLELKIREAESNLLTLDIEAAAELIRKLMTELEELKEEAKQRTLPAMSAEESSEATENLSRAGRKVRFGLDSVFQHAVAGDREGLAGAAQETANTISNFNAALAHFADASGDPASQQLIMEAGVEAVNGATVMMTNAQRTVLNPANPLSTQSLLESSNIEHT